jgi:hypothetical protein
VDQREIAQDHGNRTVAVVWRPLAEDLERGRESRLRLLVPLRGEVDQPQAVQRHAFAAPITAGPPQGQRFEQSRACGRRAVNLEQRVALLGEGVGALLDVLWLEQLESVGVDVERAPGFPQGHVGIAEVGPGRCLVVGAGELLP